MFADQVRRSRMHEADVRAVSAVFTVLGSCPLHFRDGALLHPSMRRSAARETLAAKVAAVMRVRACALHWRRVAAERAWHPARMARARGHKVAQQAGSVKTLVGRAKDWFLGNF